MVKEILMFASIDIAKDKLYYCKSPTFKKV